MLSVNQSMDNAMIEHCKNQQVYIGRLFKGQEIIGMGFHSVEGVCTKIYFDRLSDAIVYVLKDKEEKLHYVFEFCLGNEIV